MAKIKLEQMAEKVEESFRRCLFEENEDTSNYVEVCGISCNYGLHPQRLEGERENIKAILEELPEEFKKGYTFLALCYDKEKRLWTGDQRICEQLVVMAIGLKLMSYCLPYEMWSALPGGMPYVIILK